MCNYLYNIINTESGFLLNAAANRCLTPLYGVLSLCGVERHLFRYSIETRAFTEAPREFQERSRAIQLLSIKSVYHKCILREIDRWWSGNLEKLPNFPSIFRLFLKASNAKSFPDSY